MGEISGAKLAFIVASLHGRSGKTLLARALVDYFVLSGGRPHVFDTDAVERGLHMLFPRDARVVDLTVVRDQMLLFDTLAKRSSQARVVAVTHRSLTKFFELMRETLILSPKPGHAVLRPFRPPFVALTDPEFRRATNPGRASLGSKLAARANTRQSHRRRQFSACG